MDNDNITLSLQDIKEKGYGVENNIVSFELSVIGHFGNSVSLVLMGENIILYSGYNNTANIGFIIQYLVELFDISREDGIYLSEMKDIPVRLIVDSPDCSWGSRCVGVGNFMKDKFVLFDALAKLGADKFKDS